MEIVIFADAREEDDAEALARRLEADGTQVTVDIDDEM